MALSASLCIGTILEAGGNETTRWRVESGAWRGGMWRSAPRRCDLRTFQRSAAFTPARRRITSPVASLIKLREIRVQRGKLRRIDVVRVLFIRKAASPYVVGELLHRRGHDFLQPSVAL